MSNMKIAILVCVFAMSFSVLGGAEGTSNRHELLKSFYMPFFNFDDSKIKDKPLDEAKEILMADVMNYVGEAQKKYAEVMSLDYSPGQSQFQIWLVLNKKLKYVTSVDQLTNEGVKEEVTKGVQDYFKAVTAFYDSTAFMSNKQLAAKSDSLAEEVKKLRAEFKELSEEHKKTADHPSTSSVTSSEREFDLLTKVTAALSAVNLIVLISIISRKKKDKAKA